MTERRGDADTRADAIPRVSASPRRRVIASIPLRVIALACLACLAAGGCAGQLPVTSGRTLAHRYRGSADGDLGVTPARVQALTLGEAPPAPPAPQGAAANAAAPAEGAAGRAEAGT